MMLVTHHFITVDELLKKKGEIWNISLLSLKKTRQNRITSPFINRPGLALAGYTSYFLQNRIQILGKTEHSYLTQLEPSLSRKAVKRITALQLTCIILTKGLRLPVELERIILSSGAALLQTNQDTTPFIQRITNYLNEELADRVTIHGTLVEVHGVGCLLTGSSGIGKSECALDLVTRGHRLVGDDVVELRRIDEDTLIGWGNNFLGHLMEIRGIGIIDIKTIYGLKSVRIRKKVDVEIVFSPEQESDIFPRINIDDTLKEYLYVNIPQIRIPIIPGKNISVLVEMVALHHLAKIYGILPARELSQRLVKMLKEEETPELTEKGRLEEPE